MSTRLRSTALVGGSYGSPPNHEFTHIREADTPAGHLIRVHSDGSRELVKVQDDGSMYVVRSA